jgi:hypothetical protein
MALTTPKHRASLWIVTNAAWVAVVPAAALYFDRQLRRGAYPVDADSIGIPIVGIAMWVTVLLLPLNVVWWLLLRRYPGRVPLRTSSEGLRIGPRFISALGLVFAMSCAGAAVWALADDASEITPVFFAWSYITFAIRAAYVRAVRNGEKPTTQSSDALT